MNRSAVAEYRWLLPSAPGAGPGASTVDRPPRRSTRDWAVDTLCFVLGAGYVVFGTADVMGGHPAVFAGHQAPPWVLWLDPAVGLIAAVMLWWRRRWPVAVGLATALGVFISGTSMVSFLIMTFTVAVHRRFAVAAAIAAFNALGAAAFYQMRPDRTTAFWVTMAGTVVYIVLAVLGGTVVRSRRLLVLSLRDRAERAEAEQQLRVAQARVLERTRIAREMHDVLAHRISLLSLHAGALEIRPDAAPADVARAAGVIRASAHQALQDLRQVIGVLREPSAGLPVERPQPTIAGLPPLIAESRDAGVPVRLDLRVDAPSEVPDGIGRAAYRIVQEALTNARRHAPGAQVSVTVAGAPGEQLRIDVHNGAAAGGSAPAPPSAGTGLPSAGTGLPGAGTGLIGLAERATLAGGGLRHGPDGSGGFALHAWLPWSA